WPAPTCPLISRQILGVSGPSGLKTGRPAPRGDEPSKAAAPTVFRMLLRDTGEFMVASFCLLPTAFCSSESDPNGFYLERFHGHKYFCPLDRKRFRGHKLIPFHHVGFTRRAGSAREVKDGGSGFVRGLIQPDDV